MPWTCPACGSENPEGTRFCGHCGSPRPPVAEPAGADPPAAEPKATGSAAVAATAPVPRGSTGPVGEEERRLITALFADISGFTALADRVDTETLLEIIDPIVNRLSEVVARYDGHVEKFAGDAILALFGAPIAHEDDAARALAVALEMHREIELIRPTLPAGAEGLTLHIGVNSGHGIARMLGSGSRMDYAVLGDAVILAQRLESVAPTGSTYVGETTRELARERFEFEPVGELTLKGKAEPVLAWRLVRETVPTSGRRDASRVHRLQGRDQELSRLSDLLGTTAEPGAGREGLSSPGALAAVLGEPGVGKTTLVAAAREAAIAGGVRWLDTRCLAYGAGIPYRPFAELVRNVAGVRLDDLPETVAPAIAAALGATGSGEALPFFLRLAGVAGDQEPVLAGMEPEAVRRGIHGAVVEWLRRLAAAGPLVVHVEDIHWADTSSLELLADLAGITAEVPLIVSVTARPEGEGRVADLLAAAGPVRSATLELGPLDGPALARLVSDVLGHGTPPPALLVAIAERTGGNPFFAEEIVRGLLDDRTLVWTVDDAWALAPHWDMARVPLSIEGALAARLDRLPPRETRVLQVASVMGRRIRGALLAAVDDAEGLDEAADRLVEGGFLDRLDAAGHDSLAFHHALVQDVAYARLLKRRQRELHLRVAEAAEALYGAGDDTIDLLARHLYLGGGGTKAIDYLLRAGARARRLYANDEAIAAYERAIEVALSMPNDQASPAAVVDLRLDLADLYALRGRNDEALATYRLVADETGSVRAWSGAGLVLNQSGAYAEALEVVADGERSIVARPGSDERTDLRPLRLVEVRALQHLGRVADALATADRALASSPAADVVRGQILLDAAWASAGAGPDGVARALARSSEAYGLFEAADDLRKMVMVDQARGEFLRRSGDFNAAAEVLERGLRTATMIGSSQEIAGCLDNLAFVETEQGRYDAALAHIDAALAEHRRTRSKHGLVFATSNRAETLVRMGRAAEARDDATEALRLAREIGNAFVVADALDTLAKASALMGDDAAAAGYGDEAVEAYLALDERPAATSSAEVAAAAWERLGDPERAAVSRVRVPVSDTKLSDQPD